MNNGLEEIWEYLTRRYQGMDKASIIRLALNTLARQSQPSRPRSTPAAFRI